ncbi:aminopeptidase N [Methylopila capsulata]|uniref:Aminopeptidase N n=1 Tax=Methylopila capsulata TaxID=61654 RepID=A0A9W6IVB6_9HYPH|nr:aminopeptidase N [Methylopila capsulata]MBM7852081.1 aminopeptidase N [Methylopila capsulata]GLK56287.1 aminopeptidase N [Methylopila capsulata]
MRAEDPQLVRLADYRPSDFLIDTVDLDVNLDPHATRVTARLKVRPNPEGRENAALALDGDELKLVSVAIDGAELEADAIEVSPERLSIANPPRGPFELTIVTKIDPTANTRLMGLYRSNASYTTQCEAEGFRRITYFLDRPDVLAVYTTRIEGPTDETPLLLSNGNLMETGPAGRGRSYAVWHDPHPKPSYLFALVAGDLAKVSDTFVTLSGRTVAVEVFVEHGKEDRAPYALDAIKRSMRWDEEVFGREYDLDVFMVVAVSHFNMGAMENKGLNVFNDKYVLASPETATDGDYANIEAIIAHEYFHNWTGNRITCRDWFQLCLKEGLTVFRDQEFTSDTRSRPVKRIQDVRALRAAQFAEDSGPLAHPVRPQAYAEINNFYTPTVYEKGAEVIRMLKVLIGPEAFKAGMDLYFDRHDGQACTIEQFIACFAEVSGRDLGQFMLWYHQAGTPEVTIRTAYDAAAKTFTVTAAQRVPATPGQPTKQPAVVPMVTGLVGPDGADMPLVIAGAPAGPVFALTEAETTLVFEQVPVRPAASLFRNFSAPVKLSTDLTDDDLLFLAKSDSDPFNRWQAGQTVALRNLVARVDAQRAGAPAPEEPRLAEAVARAFDPSETDHAFAAQVAALPSEGDVAREIGEDVDPDAIHAARAALKLDLARRLAGPLAAAFERLVDEGPYSPDAASASRRALKISALDYLAAGGAPDGVARAKALYDGATNMTDRIMALQVLSLSASDARDAALADFHDRYKSDPLLIDKWFLIQASAPLPDTLDRVRALMTTPAFDIRNPNRVRSLVGAFGSGNPTQFNRADGLGYAFVAEVARELNGTNPQVAARLLGAFKTWRALEPVRRGKAEAALRAVAAAPGLSPDVGDIVRRALG